MKTRVLIALTLIAIISVIFLVRAFKLSQTAATPFVNGKYVEFTIHIPKGTWSYEPNHILLTKGDRFRVTIFNDDDIDHGFAIDAYGVNEVLSPHSSRQTRELLAVESGTFTFYCSLMCSEGVVATGTYRGQTRGHFDMEGTIKVIEYKTTKSENY